MFSLRSVSVLTILVVVPVCPADDLPRIGRQLSSRLLSWDVDGQQLQDMAPIALSILFAELQDQHVDIVEHVEYVLVAFLSLTRICGRSGELYVLSETSRPGELISPSHRDGEFGVAVGKCIEDNVPRDVLVAIKRGIRCSASPQGALGTRRRQSRSLLDSRCPRCTRGHFEAFPKTHHEVSEPVRRRRTLRRVPKSSG